MCHSVIKNNTYWRVGKLLQQKWNLYLFKKKNPPMETCCYRKRININFGFLTATPIFYMYNKLWKRLMSSFFQYPAQGISNERMIEVCNVSFHSDSALTSTLEESQPFLHTALSNRTADCTVVGHKISPTGVCELQWRIKQFEEAWEAGSVLNHLNLHKLTALRTT